MKLTHMISDIYNNDSETRHDRQLSSTVSEQSTSSTEQRYCEYPGGCSNLAMNNTRLCSIHESVQRIVSCQVGECGTMTVEGSRFCSAHCPNTQANNKRSGSDSKNVAHYYQKQLCQDPSGCPRLAKGLTNLCLAHGGGRRCEFPYCKKSAEGSTRFCVAHGGGRRCHELGCSKSAQGNTTRCKAHGGGRRCHVITCTKSAQGSTNFCKGHGGGKRCVVDGCTKSARDKTDLCIAHGGGKRCQTDGCTKAAVGTTEFCIGHGGGKRCSAPECTKSARGGSDFCRAHNRALKSLGHGDLTTNDVKPLAPPSMGIQPMVVDPLRAPMVLPEGQHPLLKSFSEGSMDQRMMQMLTLVDLQVKHQTNQLRVLDAHIRAQQQTIEHLVKYYSTGSKSGILDPPMGEAASPQSPSSLSETATPAFGSMMPPGVPPFMFGYMNPQMQQVQQQVQQYMQQQGNPSPTTSSTDSL